MPTTVRDIDGEPVEVLTTADVRSWQRFWFGTFGVVLIGTALSGVVWGVRLEGRAENTRNDVARADSNIGGTQCRGMNGHVCANIRLTNLESVVTSYSADQRDMKVLLQRMAKALGVKDSP